jgi:hypothetical protein
LYARLSRREFGLASWVRLPIGDGYRLKASPPTDWAGELSWCSGSLAGTSAAITQLDEFCRNTNHAGVTPTGPFLPIDLTDPLSAYVTALNVFRAPRVNGSPPTLPDTAVPDGAIP